MKTYYPLTVYYRPIGVYLSYYSPTYRIIYYDGYGWNFYYGQGGYYEYSINPSSTLITTYTSPSGTRTTVVQKSSAGGIIGAVVGICLFCSIVCCIIWCMRKAKVAETIIIEEGIHHPGGTVITETVVVEEHHQMGGPPPGMGMPGMYPPPGGMPPPGYHPGMQPGMHPGMMPPPGQPMYGY